MEESVSSQGMLVTVVVQVAPYMPGQVYKDISAHVSFPHLVHTSKLVSDL